MSVLKECRNYVNCGEFVEDAELCENCESEASDSPACYSPEGIAALERDAIRYRFLRDEDNWGEDSGEDCWERLGESHANVFDEIIDSRMSKSE